MACLSEVVCLFMAMMRSWIRGEYTSEQPGRSQIDLMYKSEQDNFNGETVAIWKDDWVIPKYQRFMQDFQAHFVAKKAIIDEISIGTGPAGELRYPSYNSHDSGSGWPNRGFLQAYSDPARADFRAWVLANYGNLAGVNRAWSTSLESADEIGPPDDGTAADGRASTFVQLDDFRGIPYGKDFIDWYNGALVEHGRRMLETANESFGGAFATIPLGIKIPGIHWQMAATASHPRIAEIAAGQIRTSVDYTGATSGHGYGATVAMVHRFHNVRAVNLHFTALEMDNCEDTGTCQIDASQAKALVFWVAQAADANQVTNQGRECAGGRGHQRPRLGQHRKRLQMGLLQRTDRVAYRRGDGQPRRQDPLPKTHCPIADFSPFDLTGRDGRLRVE